MGSVKCALTRGNGALPNAFQEALYPRTRKYAVVPTHIGIAQPLVVRRRRRATAREILLTRLLLLWSSFQRFTSNDLATSVGRQEPQAKCTQPLQRRHSRPYYQAVSRRAGLEIEGRTSRINQLIATPIRAALFSQRPYRTPSPSTDTPSWRAGVQARRIGRSR
jgi:hypothetical protein